MTSAPPHSSPGATRVAGALASTVSDSKWKPATWILLIVLCGALFLDGLDLTMVGVALPDIGRDLHLSASSLQWIVSGYVLGYGSLLLLGGRASDLLGRRRVFLAALCVFGAASVVSTFVDSDILLIALRFIKGASAAFTVPAGLSIINTTFTEGKARSRAMGIYAACGASGFSLGLIFGGLLTELNWRLTFLVPGPIALALVVAGLRVIPRVPREKLSLSGLDLRGAVTCTAALLLLVYAVVEAPTHGWGSLSTIGLLALSVALMAVFVVLERRHATPLLRLGILRSAPLVHANISAAVMFGGYVAFQFLVTLYVQNSLGWSPIHMALAFLPGGLIVVLSGSKIPLLLERFSTVKLLLAGLLAFAAAYALFLRVSPGQAYANFMLPTILLLGVGFALCFPAVNVQATAGVKDEEQGLASGILNSSLQIGGAIVLAVVTAILGTGTTHIQHAQLLPHMKAAIGVTVGITIFALLVTVVQYTRNRRQEAAAVEAEPSERPEYSEV
ncbi:MFS transporter [Streptomyces liangshanensis]|nr:MFS transporter [Streptomyces liangshanensis]